MVIIHHVITMECIWTVYDGFLGVFTTSWRFRNITAKYNFFRSLLGVLTPDNFGQIRTNKWNFFEILIIILIINGFGGILAKKLCLKKLFC